MNQGKIWWWIVAVMLIAAVVVAAAVYQFRNMTNIPKPELDDFAKCVTSKGWTMYGAYWCGHCQQEKKNYGSAFQYINYVECTKQETLCLDKKIGGYPTWISPAGEHYEGELGLEKMSELSGCALPASY